MILSSCSIHRPHHLIHVDSIPQEHPFTFLIMMEVVLVGGLVVGSWTRTAVDDRADPQLTISSSHIETTGDASPSPPAPAVAELRMRMVAAIRGGRPPRRRSTRASHSQQEEEEEGAERSPAPRLRRSRRRMRGGLGGHDGQPGGILT